MTKLAKRKLNRIASLLGFEYDGVDLALLVGKINTELGTAEMVTLRFGEAVN